MQESPWSSHSSIVGYGVKKEKIHNIEEINTHTHKNYSDPTNKAVNQKFPITIIIIKCTNKAFNCVTVRQSNCTRCISAKQFFTKNVTRKLQCNNWHNAKSVRNWFWQCHHASAETFCLRHGSHCGSRQQPKMWNWLMSSELENCNELEEQEFLPMLSRPESSLEMGMQGKARQVQAALVKFSETKLSGYVDEVSSNHKTVKRRYAATP